VELTAAGLELLFIPEGCAQGFQTLEPDTEVLYKVSQRYSPEHERGFRYDDPKFGISWPLSLSAISEKDRSWPDLAESGS
jgi:dTDP-4-dehydrorhamnose 3,5-epimerase